MAMILDMSFNTFRKDLGKSDSPFSHYIFDNFFIDSAFRQLQKEFKFVLRGGLYANRDQVKSSTFAFTRAESTNWVGESYDAYICAIPPQVEGILSVFYSVEFFSFVQSLFDFKLNNCVTASFHHHLPESKDGHVHTDYEICNFEIDPLQNGINAHNFRVKYQ